MKKIEFTIGEAGGITVDAQGFQGKACEKATAEILKQIGGEVTKTTDKPEKFTHTGNQQKASR
jgi:hypothetical protein